MTRLSWWLIRAQFMTRRTATALSMLAIALGVSLGYAIHLINDAALADFSQAMKSVQGEPDAVLAPKDSSGHVPLALVDALAKDEAVALAVPVIETRVRLDDTATTVRLIGLDVFSAALLMPNLMPRLGGPDGGTTNIFEDGVYASPALLARLNTKVGAGVTATRGEARWTTRIRGDLPAVRGDELLLVADIAWVQAHFGPREGVGEVRLRLAPGIRPATWIATWSARLPAGLGLRAADDNLARMSNVSRAYRVNLNVLAMVALLTGAFLVFATQLTAVAQRSTQFALLGVLGLPPRMRLAQVLVEGLAIGIPGAAAGLGLGYGLAVLFTRLLGGDLGGGFFAASSPVVVPQLAPALGFFVLGCGASLMGALYPAWLNRVQPLALALKTGFAQLAPAASAAPRRGRQVALVLVAVAAVALTRLPAIDDLPLAGYTAIALVLVLGIAAAPAATRLVFGTLARTPLSAPLRIAVQNILQAPLMAQVAASGLIVSFALTVSMVTMVSSFRTALDHWLDDVLPAPMYMRSKGVPLPADMLAELQRPQSPFARAERMATVMLTLDPRRPPVALLVRELDRADPATRLPFTGAVLAAPPGRITVWISEPLQELHGLMPGQTPRLPLLGREVEVFVGGVWRDYARQFGAVVIAAADYRALGGSVAATDLALWPRPGQEDVASIWMREQAKRHGIEGASSGEIRELSLSIFDKSFAVTYALEAAAMLIGLFGLAVTLAASVWLRARELATLSALGFDRAMLGRAIVFEGALIAVIGLALGLACGIAVGAILTHVVNPQAFHWRMPLQIPWTQVLLGAALTLVAGMGASRFAARQATRLPAAQVLASVQ
jgi:putative ABC transport system permease protein